jgi:hypothetical protein
MSETGALCSALPVPGALAGLPCCYAASSPGGQIRLCATDARHATCSLPRWDGLYERGKPLSDYFARLPRHVAWTCDPSGKNERLELKKAGFNIREGINAKAFGINLVTRWLRSGRLKIVRALCPNLCSEAPRYTTPAPATACLNRRNP